jgi:hypothetical protein
MNNKLAMVSVAVVLSLALVPTTSADYGDLVTQESSEWTVQLTDVAAPVAAGTIYRHGAGTANNFFDDVFVLNTNGAAGINQYDLVIASAGYDGSAVGELIADDMNLLVDDEEVTYAGAEVDVHTADANENGRWDEGDFAFVCGDDGGAAPTTLEPTESADDGVFCIALTDADDVSAGELVRTSDSVVDDWDDAAGVGMAAAEFCIFDSDEDGDFQGDDDGDLAWIVNSADCNLANDNVLPLYSIEAFGDGMSFGTVTTEGSSAFTSTITTDFDGFDPACLDDACGTFTVFRHGAGTANNFFDDVIIYDLDDLGTVSQYDQVLASSGYDGSEAGGIVEDDMTLLNGDAEGLFACDGAAVFCNTLVYDVNEDGKYNTDDTVVFCVDDAAFTAVFSTEAAAGGAFCIYLTAYTDSAAGDFVRTGDDILDDFAGDEFALGDAAQIVYFDADNDGDFEADDDGDMSWVDLTGATTGDTLPRYSIELFGGSLGTQVGAEDAVIRILDAGLVTGLPVYRDDAGTANNFFDDVFVLDLNDDGDLNQFDFVLATSGYDGSEVGGLIADDMTLLTNLAPTPITGDVITFDIDEDGNFNEGDGVVLCDTPDLHPTTDTAFCIALTDAAGLSPGDLVRTSSDIMDDWDGEETSRAGTADVCYYDADNDASDFEGDEDLAWLAIFGCAGADFVGLYWVELYGEFGSLGGGGDTGEDPDDTNTTTTTTTTTGTNVTTTTGPTTTGPTTTGPTVTDGTTSDSETEDGNDTPGFELVALVAALGVALILVRRKL